MTTPTFYFRTTGNNSYAGTSATLLGTATVSSSGTTVTATTSVFNSSMVGQGITPTSSTIGISVFITSYISPTQVVVDIAPAWTSQAVYIGGPWANVGAGININALAATWSGHSITSITAYFGAGYYANSGIQTNIACTIIGDVSGQYTGDAGEVIFSAFTSGTKSAPQSTNSMLGSNVGTFTASNLTIIGGASNGGCLAISALTNYTFNDCVFNSLANGGTTNSAIYIFNSSTVNAMNVAFNRCVIVNRTSSTGAAVLITLYNQNTGIQYSSNISFKDCYIQNFGATGSAIQIASSGNTGGAGGGVTVTNCNLLGPQYGFYNQGTYLSSTYPNTVYNSIVACGLTAFFANYTNVVDGGYNVVYASTLGATAGTGTILNNIEPRLELGQSTKLSGITKPFLTPLAGSPLLGYGSAGSPPTVDFLNRPKPSGGGASTGAVGFLERHDFAIQDTSVYPSGYTSSAKLVGPGDQWLFLPVDATATTISLQVYQGSGYAGTNYATATILANGELGIGAQTVTASSTLSAWQTLTFSSITPSKAGFITLQVTSYDTSGTGTLNFGAIL